MSASDFVSHSAERLNADQRRAWFKARAAAANKSGARWHRFNLDEATGILSYEGWKVRPANEQHVSGPGGSP